MKQLNLYSFLNSKISFGRQQSDEVQMLWENNENYVASVGN